MNTSKHSNTITRTTRISIIKAALILGIFTLFSVLIIAFTHNQTIETIEQNKRAFILKNLNIVLPKNIQVKNKKNVPFYNSNLLENSFSVSNTLLNKKESIIYPAFYDTKPVGAILTVIAPNGYNGKIKLLVGIKDVEGKAEIITARVVEHKETPGLGDPIETQRSDWIFQYNKKSLDNPELKQWMVKKDGGEFDQLTGATITPRAVTEAIKNALLYYNKQRDFIFSRHNNAKPEDE